LRDLIILAFVIDKMRKELTQHFEEKLDYNIQHIVAAL
jgi:hypothetical protein